MNKFLRIKQLIEERVSGDVSILDIGCRGQELKPYVEHLGTYDGADLFQSGGGVRFVGDFTQGLPIDDQAYDVTVAADVIEHTDSMDIALDEMMRVTKHVGIVILPNHAHWSYRLKFLVGGRLSDKFDIAYPLPLDRHRFITNYQQCESFMRDYARASGLECEQLPANIGRIAPVIEKTLGKMFPNLMNRNMLYILSRPAARA